ncbi:hypothetical protein POF45_28015 [Pseudomonas sp. 681]|uniref:Lipoprotein n=1 Tax=Pseudomonas fungipugnans TaxID=3024217 RepID=A0ABT6QWH1_9PSED|nr:hypothetical protein [Pseudomonas sp. 681]MDI2595239.1 hypothetical protein [Pseudomonas sp. 681]
MSLLFRLAGAVLAVSLTGCALQGNGMAEYHKRVAAERQVQNQAMTARLQAQPLPLDTTIKLGQTAVVTVNLPAEGAAPATLARLFAGCNSMKLAMEYRRAKDWTSPYALPADPARNTAQQLCQAVRDSSWKQLAGDSEDTLLLDPGTLGTANARRAIWVGIDYGRTRLDETAGTPYDRQLERVEFDCATHQTSIRLAYRLNGQTLLPPPTQPLDSALDTEQRARLTTAVCASPANLAQLAAPVLREKLPPNMPTPEIPAPLLAQVNALPQGQSTHTLSHLQFTYNASSPMVPLAVIRNSPMDLYLQPGPAPGLWRQQATGALGSERVTIRWRGLIELAATSSNPLAGKTDKQSVLTSINLDGDWQALKPGSAIAYSKNFTDSTGKPFVQKFACSVGESFAATQKVASLQGTARSVTCSANNGMNTSNVYLYLEAYDLFVEIADTSMLMVQVNTLKAAQ